MAVWSSFYAPEILKEAIATGTLDKHLQKVEVHKGDVFYVPAGIVHYWCCVDKNGKKRELHFDKAVQVMDVDVAIDVKQNPRMVRFYPGCSRESIKRLLIFYFRQIVSGLEAGWFGKMHPAR